MNAKIVIATPHKKAEDTICHQFIQKYHHHFYLDNTQGLSSLYNDAIEQCADSCDILVFMHDDLEIHDQYFLEKLHKAHQQYDIVGLAGSSNLNKWSSWGGKSFWHLMGEKKFGFVTHYIPNISSYTTSSFGPSPAECDLIDGVFMSINIKKIKEKNIHFNNFFDFHFYDLAFCLNAKERGATIGVWPIFTIHHGLGGPDDRWRKLEPEFIKQYYERFTKINS